MRIENLRREEAGDRTRVSATAIWEDRDRPKQDIYFETPAEYADCLSANPNAFLTSCAIPAMCYGERRISIDAPICPELKEGLISVMHCLHNWYGSDRRVIPIEAPVLSQAIAPAATRGAGSFFSGGIDALALLRINQLNYPPSHPRSIKDGILVYGILKGEDERDPSFRNVVDAIEIMAKDADINLITIASNAYSHIRDLDPDFQFWKLEFQGAFLAAVAHSLENRFATVSIASTYDLANLDPWGSHPLIDHHFSSNRLNIRHENAHLSRLDKTKLIGDWDVALKHLRVCNEKSSYSQGNDNCGQCEKCLRTMTALLALGLLERTTTFPQTDLSEEQLVKGSRITDSYEAACYRELMPLLSRMGRDDLVRGIRRVLARYREKDVKGILKRLDRAFADGQFLQWGKALRAKAARS
jgi:hypothetical protein